MTNKRLNELCTCYRFLSRNSLSSMTNKRLNELYTCYRFLSRTSLSSVTNKRLNELYICYRFLSRNSLSSMTNKRLNVIGFCHVAKQHVYWFINSWYQRFNNTLLVSSLIRRYTFVLTTKQYTANVSFQTNKQYISVNPS